MSEQSPLLNVRDVSKRYGNGPEIITGLNLEVYEGEVVSLVGPSGVGKTTLLKSLAGLHPITTGNIELNERPVTGPPEELALVFQDYSRSLMPWLTVRKNIAFPLRHLKLSKQEMNERIESSLKEVGLPDVENKYPWQLSGGMQQRVAIARALAYKPGILIMDEPFASVDAQTRFDLEDLTLRIRNDLGMTIVVVTHDIDEAVYLADRVIVLGGKPSRVISTLDVPLGRKRNQIHTRNESEFGALRTEVLQLIRAASGKMTEPAR